MRVWLSLAVMAAMSAGALAQDLETQMRDCRTKTVAAERLECLDAIPLPELPAATEDSAAAWSITEGKSPLDDSPSVTAALAAQPPSKLLMIVRCRESRTELLVSADGPIDFTQQLAVSYRLGQAPAVQANWGTSTNGRAVFSPPAATISTIRSIPENGRVFFRVRGQIAQHEGTFNTAGIDEVRRRVSIACRCPAEGARRR